MALIGLLSPSRFQATRTAFGSAWPSWVLAALAASGLLAVALNRARITWAARRVREPFLRRISEEPEFEGAADALAACPQPFKTRFAFAWIWAPSILYGLGVTASFSVAYFLVDAILAGGRVGWAQPVYAGAFLAGSLLFFFLAAKKLATWRLAVSVHKEVTSGY